MADFEATIQGLSAFCAGYPEKSATDAAVMKQYIESHNVSGITTSGNSITFTLTKPAPWLVGAMTLAPFSAVPIEAEDALPGTPGVYNHMFSDGPYQITSYTPKKEFKFTRNPQWQASTDPLRKAYVNAINVDETGNQTTIYQQMPTGSPSLGMSFDALTPPADTPNLLNQIKSGGHNVNLGATYSSNPYLVFNTVSPNNGTALGKADVRQALSYGIQRSQLQKVLGGPIVNPALTHILPTGIDGSQGVPAGYVTLPGASYHHMWWVLHNAHGAYCARGIHGHRRPDISVSGETPRFVAPRVRAEIVRCLRDDVEDPHQLSSPRIERLHDARRIVLQLIPIRHGMRDDHQVLVDDGGRPL